MDTRVPSKGSALQELLARTVKPSVARLTAAVDAPSGESSNRGTRRAGDPGSSVVQSSPILPPSAIICLKNGIELEFNQ